MNTSEQFKWSVEVGALSGAVSGCVIAINKALGTPTPIAVLAMLVSLTPSFIAVKILSDELCDFTNDSKLTSIVQQGLLLLGACIVARNTTIEVAAKYIT